MERAAIIEIVLGSMLFVLGLLPGLIGRLMEGLGNFRDHPSLARRPIHHIQTDMPRYGDISLAISGGGMMILGLLLSS
jgi:hypothetical protein